MMIIEWFTNAWAGNQFLVGTMTPIIFGALLYSARAIAVNCLFWIKTTFKSSITLMSTSSEDDYHLMASFLREHIVIERFQRNITIDSTWKYDPTKNRFKAKTQDSLGYGNSWGIFGNSIVLIQRNLVKDSAAVGSSKPPENFVISIFSLFPKKSMDLFMKKYRSYGAKKSERNVIQILKAETDYPKMINWKPKRSIDTMNIKQEVKDSIVRHLEDFYAKREECEKYGIPWHTGILFYGKPGTGKTSMTHVIASHLNKDIAFYTGSASITDTTINPEEMILALEDIDALGINVSESDRSKKKDMGKDSASSLSEILNYLDGFVTPHGLIVIATTNHIDKLDPAVIRKGRFDLIVDMDSANLHEKNLENQ